MIIDLRQQTEAVAWFYGSKIPDFVRIWRSNAKILIETDEDGYYLSHRIEKPEHAPYTAFAPPPPAPKFEFSLRERAEPEPMPEPNPKPKTKPKRKRKPEPKPIKKRALPNPDDPEAAARFNRLARKHKQSLYFAVMKGFDLNETSKRLHLTIKVVRYADFLYRNGRFPCP